MSFPINNNYLECPVTLETISQASAVMTNCGHVFSYDGLTETIRSRGIEFTLLFDRALEEKLQATEKVLCPICRERITAINIPTSATLKAGNLQPYNGSYQPGNNVDHWKRGFLY